MKLIQKIKRIEVIDFGPKTKVDRNFLSLNKSEIEGFLKSKIQGLKSISLEIVKSNENKRIFRIFDVIEPRMKLDPPETDYPGIISKIGEVGCGETCTLKNIAVVLIDTRKKDWRPIVEHTESYAEISDYARINLICIDIKLENESDNQLYYRSLYIAGLYLSIFLCYTNGPDNFDDQYVFTSESNKKQQHKIGYFFQLCSAQYATKQTGPIFLGKTGDNFLPIAISPSMAIDGAVTRNFFEQGFDTYHIQNNAVIFDLLMDETINFAGIVISTSSMNNQERERNAVIAANLFKNLMNVEAVVMTKAFGGASNLDLEKLANELLKDNILSVPIIQATSIEEKLSDSLIFQTNIFKHLVCSGWTHQKVTLPVNVSTLFQPDNLSSGIQLILEIEFIKGIIDNLGSTRIKVVEV